MSGNLEKTDLIKVVTYDSDGQAEIVGNVRISPSGQLEGVIHTPQAVRLIREMDVDSFVLYPVCARPFKQEAKIAEGDWANDKERVWNIAAALVGQIILEGNQIEVREHLHLIRDTADWLLDNHQDNK